MQLPLISNIQLTGDCSKDTALGRDFANELILYVHQTKDLNAVNAQLQHIRHHNLQGGVVAGFATGIAMAFN
jgi:hypothetical protein